MGTIGIEIDNDFKPVNKEFNFEIHEKITVWEKHKYTVEAPTYVEALEIMKREFVNTEFMDNFVESEIMYDTGEFMTPEDNDNQATKELLYNDKVIIDNIII